MLQHTVNSKIDTSRLRVFAPATQAISCTDVSYSCSSIISPNDKNSAKSLVYLVQLPATPTRCLVTLTQVATGVLPDDGVVIAYTDTGAETVNIGRCVHAHVLRIGTDGDEKQ